LDEVHLRTDDEFILPNFNRKLEVEFGQARSIWASAAALIYRRTKNLRVVQLLLGHTKLESTVRYLGIEVDDALEISEQTEV
jgi:site-specific recombinase XerC